MIDADNIREAAMVLKSGLLAAAGGVVGYLVDVQRGKQFSWMQYGVFILVAFFVGQVLDSFLPSEMPGKGGVLMVAGTSAYPILVVLQTKVASLIEKLQ
jgi:hypothetical protein